jgi:glutamate-5-semialdehyde dehydrogenase
VTEAVASEDEVRAVAARAREAAAELAPLSRAAKDAALIAMAQALIDAQDSILEAAQRIAHRPAGAEPRAGAGDGPGPA